LFIAFPCVHHHEHLVLAFICILVCFNNILITYQKKCYGNKLVPFFLLVQCILRSDPPDL